MSTDWHALDAAGQLALGEQLRDRFLARSAQRRDDPELRALVDAIDPEPIARLDGLAISFHPTARFKAIRFVELRRLDPAIQPRFACPSPDAPHLAAVFVDPAELSYRSFENLIPLDWLFDGAALALRERSPLGRGGLRFAIEAGDVTRAALARLDQLGLYVPPLNAQARGGERFIFHSVQLGDALTRAVQRALPADWLAGFSHVNPVFRCNRFEPGDDRFHRHLDTPYYDRARRHISRLTLLLYLTGGEGAPALELAGESLTAIPAMTAVIFDQRLEHEGAPYRDGRKVFLRSELIFEDRELGHDPAIGRLFARACYLSGESLFAPELARHADACFARAAEAHWHGLQERRGAPEPFLHKQLGGVHWLTNGHDYWFPRNAASLEACAALTLLDYFNCTVGAAAFRARCTSELVAPGPTPSWIDELLAPHDAPPDEPPLAELAPGNLFPAPGPAVDCCPLHGAASGCAEGIDYYTRAQRFARDRIAPAPLYVMGQQIFFDYTRFVVEPGMIHVLSRERLDPVHFAGCQGDASEHVDVVARVDVIHPLVPPILRGATPRCHHLMFDFFRNTWLASSQQYTVAVPGIDDRRDAPGPTWSDVTYELHDGEVPADFPHR